MKQEKPEQENWKNEIEKKGTTKEKKTFEQCSKGNNIFNAEVGLLKKMP